MKPDPVARQFRAHRERQLGRRRSLGQIPSVEAALKASAKLSAGAKTAYDRFKADPEKWVADAVSGLPPEWAASFRATLAAEKVPAKEAHRFLSEWSSLAWNSRVKSEQALDQAKRLDMSKWISWAGFVRFEDRQIVEKFGPAWETELRDQRLWWDGRDPALRETLRYLASAGRDLERHEVLEVVRQAASYADHARHNREVMLQNAKTIRDIQAASKNIDFQLGLETLAKWIEDATAWVLETAAKIVAAVAGGSVRGILKGIPWWVWAGLGVYAVVILRYGGMVATTVGAGRKLLHPVREAV